MFIIFENSNFKRFSPLIEFRPLFFIKAGLYSWASYIKKKIASDFPEAEIKFFTERHLINEKYNLLSRNEIPTTKKKVITYISGAIIPNQKNYEIIKKVRREEKEITLTTPQGELLLFQTQNSSPKNFIDNLSSRLQNKFTKNNHYGLSFFDNIFDIAKSFTSTFKEHLHDLEREVKNETIKRTNQNWFEVKPGVYQEKSNSIKEKSITFDTGGGPIFLEENVKIEPWVHLVGPLYLSYKAEVKSFSRCYGSYFGEMTKIAGEVSNSLIDSFSNKNHHGFLGNSLVGAWVNLGAGTTTSNLKNTYGQIKGKLLGSKEMINTREVFLGSVIGDFAKVGINTSIYAGKLVGFGANVVQHVKQNVANFSFDASETNLWKINSFLAMAGRIFKRRGINFSAGGEINRRLIESIYSTNIN